jgi:hypothetical protein
MNLKLDMGKVSEDFFSDSAMIGISTALPAYRFCWLLYNKLAIDFIRKPELDVEYHHSKDEIHFFALYEYIEPHSTCIHYLYKLKSETKALLKEIKQLDYLWCIKSQTADKDALELIDKIMLIPEVQLTQIIHPERLKSLNHLLL